jgi:hypothetical protein
MRRQLALAAALLAMTPAVAEAGPSTFSTDLGSPYPTGANSYGVVATDFNVDGALDLAVVNGTSSDLSVYLGQPGGGFLQESGSPFDGLVGPNYAAAAPFYPDGDPLPDLAVANFNTGSVSVWIRNPTGGFSDEPNGGSPLPVGGQTGSVATADLGGDARADIVATDMTNGRIRVFIRQITGFTQRETITVGASPRQLTIGDFNGDGQADVATANLNSDNVTVLIGDRERGLTPEATIPVGDGPDAVAAGDFNADGRVDLAVSNLNADTVQLLLRNAANTGFDAGAPVAVPDAPLNLAAADFDADGRADVAVTSNGGGAVTILDGGTTPGTPIAIGNAYGITTADFNADARPDLAVTSDTAPGSVRVLLNTTVPVQPPPPPPPPPPAPTPTPTPPLPDPVAGRTVNAIPVSGTVRVKEPRSNRYVTLQAGDQIPVGSRVDTRDGRVTLETAGGGKADFFDGLFRITQSRGKRPLTTLTLTEALDCRSARRASAAQKRKKPKSRKLWGSGSGRFRTTGNYSAATVRGTRWLVTDRCTSTTTRVRQGSVTVRDLVKRRNVIVRASRSYTARKRR